MLLTTKIVFSIILLILHLSYTTTCSVDVAFSLDGSGSQKKEDFHNVQELIENIILNLTNFGGLDGSRAALFVFATDSKPIFDLEEYKNAKDAAQAVLNETLPGGWTATRKSLVDIKKMFDTQARAGVTKVVLLLTDGNPVEGGMSNDETRRLTTNAAQNLTDAGVKLITLTVGFGVDNAYYNGISDVSKNGTFVNIQSELLWALSAICADSRPQIDSVVFVPPKSAVITWTTFTTAQDIQVNFTSEDDPTNPIRQTFPAADRSGRVDLDYAQKYTVTMRELSNVASLQPVQHSSYIITDLLMPTFKLTSRSGGQIVVAYDLKTNVELLEIYSDVKLETISHDPEGPRSALDVTIGGGREYEIYLMTYRYGKNVTSASQKIVAQPHQPSLTAVIIQGFTTNLEVSWTNQNVESDKYMITIYTDGFIKSKSFAITSSNARMQTATVTVADHFRAWRLLVRMSTYSNSVVSSYAVWPRKVILAPLPPTITFDSFSASQRKIRLYSSNAFKYYLTVKDEDTAPTSYIVNVPPSYQIISVVPGHQYTVMAEAEFMSVRSEKSYKVEDIAPVKPVVTITRADLLPPNTAIISWTTTGLVSNVNVTFTSDEDTITKSYTAPTGTDERITLSFAQRYVLTMYSTWNGVNSDITRYGLTIDTEPEIPTFNLVLKNLDIRINWNITTKVDKLTIFIDGESANVITNPNITSSWVTRGVAGKLYNVFLQSERYGKRRQSETRSIAIHRTLWGRGMCH